MRTKAEKVMIKGILIFIGVCFIIGHFNRQREAKEIARRDVAELVRRERERPRVTNTEPNAALELGILVDELKAEMLPDLPVMPRYVDWKLRYAWTAKVTDYDSRTNPLMATITRYTAEVCVGLGRDTGESQENIFTVAYNDGRWRCVSSKTNDYTGRYGWRGGLHLVPSTKASEETA